MKILLTLASLLLSHASFAADRTFACDALKDQSGHELDVGGSFEVVDPSEVSFQLPNSVTLKFVASGHGPSTSLQMHLSDIGSSEGAIFVADEIDVQVVYSIAPAMPGLPSAFLGVRKQIGDTTYRAACHHAHS